jgi:hypothetical protein
MTAAESAAALALNPSVCGIDVPAVLLPQMNKRSLARAGLKAEKAAQAWVRDTSGPHSAEPWNAGRTRCVRRHLSISRAIDFPFHSRREKIHG